jgi:tetratricopeptide (TPR) repeat protein
VADQAHAHSALSFSAHDTNVAEERHSPAFGRDLWRMPVVLISAMLMVAAVWQASRPSAALILESALNEAGEMILSGDRSAVIERLGGAIANVIDEAPATDRAPLYATVADALLAAIDKTEAHDPVLLERAVCFGRRAEMLGRHPTSDQLARLGAAELELGRFEAAAGRLRALEVLQRDLALGPRARAARRALLRDWIRVAVDDGRASASQALDMVNMYLEDPDATPDDRAWAAARQAELLLKIGRVEEAARLLSDVIANATGVSSERMGELHAMLGRACCQAGKFSEAEAACRRALSLVESPELHSAAIRATLGWIQLGRGEHSEALATFEDVICAQSITACERGEALLGRAAALSRLGEHGASRADFLALSRIAAEHPNGTFEVIGRALQTLTAIHDSAMALGDPSTAVAYVELASSLITVEELPAHILSRLADTNRVLGERTLDSDARRERFQASAAAWSALAAAPSASDDESLHALWQAAECMDSAGDYPEAIALFAEVRAARSLDSAVGLAAAAREAQCWMAAGGYDEAIRLYECVIAAHSSNPIATACHVPLSRCYQMQGAPERAETELRRVVEGRTILEPASIDYHESQVALADLYYIQGRYREAIEQYSAALDRRPHDSRGAVIRLRLAESCLGNAEEIEKWVSTTDLDDSECQAALVLRDGQLREGLMRFQALLGDSAPSGDPALHRCRALEGAFSCASMLGEHALAIAFLNEFGFDDHEGTNEGPQLVNVTIAFARDSSISNPEGGQGPR